VKHRLNTKHFKHAVPQHRMKVAVISAALLSALSLGALVDTARTQPLPASAGEQSLAVMGMGRAEAAPARKAPKPATKKAAQPAKAAPAAKPAPAAKQLKHEYAAQVNFYYCGPAATRIALTARGKFPSQDTVASKLGTTENGTNSVAETTRVLNSYGTSFYKSRWIKGSTATPAEMDLLQADVVHAVSNGFPVVINIVGSATDVDGGWHGYPGGHYMTVVGYRDNGRTVQIADPAYVNGQSGYWMSTINLANWMAQRGYSA
jgi:hypothetical protein